MKFLHIADLHIGKMVNEFSMLEDQAYVLEQIVGVAVAEQVEAVVIAGDLYDRSVPPAQAVTLLDHFLQQLAEAEIPVLAVSGNHDSPQRLQFASYLLRRQGLYLAGLYEGKVQQAVLQDQYGPVEFYLLPFVRPAQVNDCLKTECCSFQECMEAVLAQLAEEEPCRPGTRRVLVTHQFVTSGGEAELSDSEQPLCVGGADLIDASVFSGFSYVALGHLHRCQQIGKGPVWYAGSPVKYSKSEARGSKYALLVELDESGQARVEKRTLQPLREMRCIRGPLSELIREEVAALGNREDYLFVTLTDSGELLDPMRTLRRVYPNIMQLEREQPAGTDGSETAPAFSQVRQSSPLELFEQFFQYATRGRVLSTDQKELLQQMMDETGGRLE